MAPEVRMPAEMDVKKDMSDAKTTVPSWQYDETTQVGGKDFTNRDVVEAYDVSHRRFRDIDGENAAIIAGLDLQQSQTIADFGCGTGAFVMQAARRCSKVHAVDTSPAMLDYTERKARSQGLTNIVYHHGGFLTYAHTDPPLDVITSSMALHHLPDFWKQKALRRLNGMLKQGGKFYLADVIYSENDCEANIADWIKKLTAQAGADKAEDVAAHIRKEYSTFTWIMEGLLARAGFRIDRAEYADGVIAKYLCTKIT